MKVWGFFYTGDLDEILHSFTFYTDNKTGKMNKSDTLLLDNKYPLYGITDSKKIAEIFEQERNMKNFIKKTFKMDKEDYIDYIDHYAQNAILEITPLTTKSNNEKEIIEVVTTSFERLEINDFDIQYVVGNDFYKKSPNKYLKIFKKEYRNLLSRLGYEFLLYINSPYDENDDYSDIYESSIFEGYDELNLLLREFRGTFV